MKKNSSKPQSKKSKKNRKTPAKIGAREKFPFYIGIDLGDKHSDVCVFDADGELKERFQLGMKEEEFGKYFGGLKRSAVAIEVGGQSRWVAETLERCGHKVYVGNSRKLAYITESDDKDDRRDAFKLAELLYTNPRLLHPIQHRSREAQADLVWVRAREAMVKCRTELINTVRGLCKSFGERLGKCSAESFPAKRGEQIPEELRPQLEPIVKMIDELNRKIGEYDRKELEIAQTKYPKYKLLSQVRGVGVHTALCFMLTIDEPNRFVKSRQVGCFLGMRPKKQDSGEQRPQLSITKAGDVFMRKTLVNCAHYILGPFGGDSDLRRFGKRICDRGGKNAKKRAVVAVARKLAVLLHRLWVSGEVYEPLRNQGKKAAAATAAAATRTAA